MEAETVWRGTIREVPSAASLAAAVPVGKAIGVTRIANVTGLDQVGVPTWMVIRPLAKSITVSQGKGLTHELAVVSGLMESIELYHAENIKPVGDPAPIMSFADDPSFVSPGRLPTRIDVALDESQVLYWVEGCDLFSRAKRWIPHDLFDMDTTRIRHDRSLFVRSSNGLASGNTLREATLHGLCEVVERDQMAFWLVKDQLAEQPAITRVDPTTIDDRDCACLLDSCAQAGLEVFVWYMTVNIDLSVFGCMIVDNKRTTMYPQRASGFGCHPVKPIALSRAITEAAQTRLTCISGMRDDITWAKYLRNFHCHNGATGEWLTRLRSQEPALDYRELPSASADASVQNLLAYALQCLANAGLGEAIAVDLTQQHLGIPVVFVCVPDAESGIRQSEHRPGHRLTQYVEANAFL